MSRPPPRLSLLLVRPVLSSMHLSSCAYSEPASHLLPWGRKIVDDKVEADWAKVAVGDFSPENFHLVTDPVSHDGADGRSKGPRTGSRPCRRGGESALPAVVQANDFSLAFLCFPAGAVEWQPWLWRQKLKSGDNAEGRLLDWAQWGSKHRWRRRGPDDVVTKGGVWGNGGKNLPAGGPWSDSSSYVDPKIQPGADATAGGGGESGAGDELDGPAWPVWARHVRRRIPLAEMVRYRQPGAKLIVSLRSPPERTASHYFMLCSARCQKALQNAGNDSAALEAEWARCGLSLPSALLFAHLSLQSLAPGCTLVA